MDDSFRLRLPDTELLRGLGIHWTGAAADFVDGSGRVIVKDPTVHALGPSALLIREDALRECLAREGLTMVWAVFGEKSVLAPGFGDGPYYPRLRLSGAYKLSAGKVSGFLKYTLDERGVEEGEAKSTAKIYGVLRSHPTK